MMPTKTSAGPNEVVCLGVLRLKPPLLLLWSKFDATANANANASANCQLQLCRVSRLLPPLAANCFFSKQSSGSEMLCWELGARSELGRSNKKQEATQQATTTTPTTTTTTTHSMGHVWYIECSSAGAVQEVVATERKDYTLMLRPDEIAGPADKLKRLQKTAMRFVKEAEEQMDVKEWAQEELGQLARRAYKTAPQPAINTAIDVWEMATPEQAQ
jgi:hypothetical protein